MRWLCLLGVCTALFIAPVTAETRFQVLTTELPPYSFLNADTDIVTGISTDILISLMDKAGVPRDALDIGIYPWARLYRNLQTTPGSVAYGMARTPEREPLFKWVGPITTMRISLLALTERDINIIDMDDINQLSIGIQPNSAPAQLLQSLGYPEHKFDYASTAEQNLRKLLAGRIDAFGFPLNTARYIAMLLDIPADRFESIYTLNEVELYFAFHPSTSDALITELNTLLQQMKQPVDGEDSEIQRIFNRYLVDDSH